MRHEVRLRGHAFEIRPVEIADAEFILRLRTDPELSPYLQPTSSRLDDQQVWMQRYFERPGDYYFLIERIPNHRAEGAVALYDVDPDHRQGEWGRWVLRKDSMAAVESALLLYRAAFDVIGVERVTCRTAATARNVIAFHSSCGLAVNPDADLRRGFGIGEDRVVEQFITRDRWPASKRLLEERARAVARLLHR